ncbi:hypothetical protein [Desulfosudis oleivorans]|uniref:Uncharacterized protein n=1 Tax=Desulfosudis oleivorans (strain DSM 6200 / JCM 39069 / Hxd3) TaxID=96561 RepID=A8ZSW5_DESOH|nr:hypothetical protein [Desulfosudis oleivorans]ABW66129.1 hypothetical protein Dole_0319 [Desulfosudis oleivorans Hxd3]
MNASIDTILTTIGDTYKDRIDPRARHYLEINIGKQAEIMGLSGLPDNLGAATAIVPLKAPAAGMKVRVDGRTFVDYAQFDSGVATPGYLARESGLAHAMFVPNDSMILNFA